MLKAADTIESDGETVVLSPAKREGETDAINLKKNKLRKIAELRMTSEELIQMRSKIAKSLTVVFEFVYMGMTSTSFSHSTFRMQFVECPIPQKGREKNFRSQSCIKFLLSG